MDAERKKQLLMDYKNRLPQKGILRLLCTQSGESFIGITQDSKASMNGLRFKLNGNTHPNKKLQALWNKCGEQTFDFALIEELEYDDLTENYDDELAEMLEKHLQMPGTEIIWRRI